MTILMKEIAYVTAKKTRKYNIDVESPRSLKRHSVAMIKLTHKMRAATHDNIYVHEYGGSNPCRRTRAFLAAISQDSVMKEVAPDGASDFGDSSSDDVANGGGMFRLSGSVLIIVIGTFLVFPVRAELNLGLVAINSFRSAS